MDFVIIDDESFWIEKINSIVKNISTVKKIKTTISNFTSYNNSLKQIIENGKRKIYIIDIKLENSKFSGYDIARIIREKNKDWDSIIIFASAFDVKSNIISDRLLALTYVSKYKDFVNNLSDTINLALNVIWEKKFITIKENRISYTILIDDILYTEKEKNSKYCLIKTTNNKYRVRNSLNNLNKELEFDIYKNYLLINKKNIILKTDKEIIFKNQLKIPLK